MTTILSEVKLSGYLTTPHSSKIYFSNTGWARMATLIAIEEVLVAQGVENPKTNKPLQKGEVIQQITSQVEPGENMAYFLCDDGCTHSFGFTLARLVQPKEVAEAWKAYKESHPIHDYNDFLRDTYIDAKTYRVWTGADGWAYYRRVMRGGLIFHGKGLLDVLPSRERNPWSMHS